jgi:hypothetical protein
MTGNLDIEMKVIERFVVKTKRDRYLMFIKSEKDRVKFTSKLAHFRDLRSELFEEVKGDEREFVKDRIKGLGKLTDCYLISESAELDQKKLDVDNALTQTIGYGMGTLIVFGDAEILYYECEGPNEKWISKPTKFK